MPVTEGLHVLTDSDLVREHRKATMQFITLNHPVDCGICDKAGECTLQDYHFAYNGSPSVSREPKVHATKFHDLSERILLDNERCILCSRCVRFTREISKSNALGIKNRGDVSLVRAADDSPLDADPYSDNVIDICPVGALLSKPFLHKARVWYLKPTPSVCPGCERGCSVNIWHRKAEWHLRALDPKQNTSIARVTPLENPAVNGPWICNKGRDLAQIFERPRADRAMQKGKPVELAAAIAAARKLIAEAKHPVAAGLELGLQRGTGGLPRSAGRAIRDVRQAGPCAAAWRAARGRPPHPPRQEPEYRRRPRGLRRGSLARAGVPRRHGPGAGVGRRLQLRDAAGRRQDHLPQFVPAARERACRCLHSDKHPDRARRHLHEFRRRRDRLRACFPKQPTVADAQDVFAAIVPGAAAKP